jgi:hypothetical protein
MALKLMKKFEFDLISKEGYLYSFLLSPTAYASIMGDNREWLIEVTLIGARASIVSHIK